MKIKVVKCTEPSDLNYGGWDMLVQDERHIPGSWACFYEATTYDRALAILNRTAHPKVLDIAARNMSEYLPVDHTPLIGAFVAMLRVFSPENT